MTQREQSKPKRPRWWWNASIVGMVVLFPAGLIATTTYRPLTNDVQGAGLGAGILVNVVAFLTIYLLGRAGLHRYRARSFVNFGSLVAFFAAGLGTVSFVNGACDPHPLEEHEVRVLRVPHRSGDVHGEAVEDWRPGHEGEDMMVPWFPDGVQPGDRVIVVAGPGLIGYWFEDLRAADRVPEENTGMRRTEGRR